MPAKRPNLGIMQASKPLFVTENLKRKVNEDSNPQYFISPSR